jgi:hypothetical protein
VPLANLPRLAVGAYLGRKRWGVPDFLYAALDPTAYAAFFFKEGRMKCAGAINLRRKSGRSLQNRIHLIPEIGCGKQKHSTVSLRSCYDTDP